MNRKIETSDSVSDSVPSDLTINVSLTPLSQVVPYLASENFNIEIQNTSNQKIHNIGVTNSDGVFSYISGCEAGIEAGQSCTLVLKFTSPGNGTHTRDLTITFKDLLNNSYSDSISVSAQGSYPGSVEVKKVYPLNGNNWNDYIQRSNSGADEMHQLDIACDPSTLPTSLNQCFNGAEKLFVRTGKSSCENLSLTEDLDAFYWWCFVENGEAIFYSGGLRHQKSLSDLLTSTGWNNNRVKVFEGSTEILDSGLSTWWTNSILPLPTQTTGVAVNIDNGGESSGRIYYLNTSASTDGLNIIDPKISIVVNPTQVLSYDGQGSYIISPQDHFIWIEGTFLDGLGGELIRVSGGRYGHIRRFNGGGSVAGAGVSFPTFDTDNWKIINSSFFKRSVLTTDRSAYSSFYYVKTTGTTIGSTAGATNSHSYVYSNILITNSPGDGYSTDRLDQLIMTNITSVSNNFDGIELRLKNNFTLRSILSANNNWGLNLDRLEKSTFVNIAGISNAIYGVRSSYTGIGSNRFEGNLLVGNNGTKDCHNGNIDVGSGIYDVTCNLSGTNNNNDYGTDHESTAFLRKSRTVNSSFVGKVTIDSNPSHTLGIQALASITDYFNFSFFTRIWGKSHTDAFPSINLKGDCTANCQIWDWALLSTDTNLLNLTVDAINPNPIFINNNPCPSQLNPNVAANITSDQKTPANQFMVHAEEILLDGLGDDDSLCESNEACIYNPNYGFYQGHGDYRTQKCIFQNGPISNVIMFSYPNNGI